MPLNGLESESFRKAKKPPLPLGGCQCHLTLMRQKKRLKSTYEWNGKQKNTVTFF